MIIKNKKNCQISYYNNNFYLRSSNFYRKYRNRKEALNDYINIKNLTLKDIDILGRAKIEIYKEDIKLLLKSLEVYKFFLKQNLFLSAEKEKLDNIFFDIDFLYEILFATYNENYSEIFENSIDKVIG